MVVERVRWWHYVGIVLLSLATLLLELALRDSKIIKEPRVMMEQGRCPQTTSPALATV